MIATVPVEGPIHVYEPGSLPMPFNVSGAVRVDLQREGVHVGWVTFSHTASQINPRATEATFLLTGAYVRVMGEAQFEVADEQTLRDVVDEIRG